MTSVVRFEADGSRLLRQTSGHERRFRPTASYGASGSALYRLVRASPTIRYLPFPRMFNRIAKERGEESHRFAGAILWLVGKHVNEAIDRVTPALGVNRDELASGLRMTAS